eukprot:1693567-Rhodomonas_salina.1
MRRGRMRRGRMRRRQLRAGWCLHTHLAKHSCHPVLCQELIARQCTHQLSSICLSSLQPSQSPLQLSS